jgi:predicted porin
MGRGIFIALAVSALMLSPAVLMGADVTVTPSIALKGEYNDNIDYTVKDKKDDYIGSVAPGLKLEYLTPRFSMKTEGKAEILRYLDVTENNTEKYDASLDGTYRYLERSSIFGHASFTRDTTLDREYDETGLIGKRVNRNTYTGGLGFLHYLTANFSVGLAYQYQRKDYSGDYYTDSYGHNVAGRLDYIFNDGIDTVSLQPVFITMRSDLTDVDEYGAALGLTHRISDTMEASIKGGAIYSDVSDKVAGRDMTGWGWTAEAGLKKRWESFTLSFDFSRQDMLDSASSFVTVNRFLLTARYDLTERLALHFTGGLYFTKSSAVLEEDNTDERSYHLLPKVSYRFTENIRLDLAYAYSNTKDRMLEEDDNEWDRNQVWLLLTFEFPNKL